MANFTRQAYRRIFPNELRQRIRRYLNHRRRIHRINKVLQDWGGTNLPPTHPIFLEIMFNQSAGYKEDVEIRFNHYPEIPIQVRMGTFDTRPFRHVFFHQQYADILKLAPNATTILDLGANVGYSALWFAMQFPEATIFAVEPEPENFARLQNQVRLAELEDRIKILEAAVDIEDGIADFYQFGDGSIHDGGSLVSDSKREIIAGQVSCMSLGSILERFCLSMVDVLKLDVEGIEGKLFSNSSSEFREYIAMCGMVAIEPHGNQNKQIVDDFFSALGWKSMMQSEIVSYFPDS